MGLNHFHTVKAINGKDKDKLFGFIRGYILFGAMG